MDWNLATKQGFLDFVAGVHAEGGNEWCQIEGGHGEDKLLDRVAEEGDGPQSGEFSEAEARDEPDHTPFEVSPDRDPAQHPDERCKHHRLERGSRR